MTHYRRKRFDRKKDSLAGKVRLRAGWFVAITLFAFALLCPSDLHAHLSLREATPAADSRLTAVPSEIRLFFTEPVELALSTISVDGPRGAVELGSLTREGSGDVLSISLLGGLAAGEYRVRWQAVGRDGHPVRGEFAFTVEAGATGTFEDSSSPSAAPEPEAADSTLPGGAGGLRSIPDRSDLGDSEAVRFSAQSPLYAGIRWLMYVGMVGVLGALGFALLLRSAGMKGLSQAYRSGTERAAAAFGILAALPLALSIPLRLQAQSHVIFGGGVTRERFSALLSSLWGAAWAVQLSACVLALCGLFLAWKGRAGGWAATAIAAAALVLTPALSGHASAVGDFRWLAIGADALHIAGAGLWIGTLAALVLIGVPMMRLEPATERGRSLSLLVTNFSPVAMAAAALLVATGMVSALFQLSAVPDLWTTPYGRLLSAKLLIVLLVVVLGAYNWRRLRPIVGEPGNAGRLRRSGGAEVTAALIVIMLTAVLVAVQPPARADAPGPASAPISEVG